MTAARTACYLQAYALWEALQGEDHAQAAADLAPLLARAEAAGWTEVAFVAAAAQAAYRVVRPGGGQPDLEGLLVRADGMPAARAVALALTALHAGSRGDAESVLRTAGRAVALLDDPGLPPLERCTAYVVCAAAYNGLGLWELVDELYDEARALAPHCPAPVQDAALAVNRVLVRAEWAACLLEAGDERAGRALLRRVLEAADDADAVALPWLWRRDVLACRTAVALLLGEADDALLARAEDLREELVAAGDLETVPLLDAARALALQAHGRRDEARRVAGLVEPRSASSGTASVLAWARARVLDPEGWRSEAGDHARLAVAQRWQARLSVLVAARSFVTLERLGAAHERLTADLTTDVLTGLANRRAFEQWLEAPPARGAGAAVLLLDLDDFKLVNDAHGHGVGDDVLRAVGALVAAQVRPGDLAARLGGDELAVVLPDADEAAATARAAAVRAAVVGHDWTGLSPGLAVRVSVGVAVGGLEQGAALLYRRADAALYAAKGRRDGVAVAERVVRLPEARALAQQ